MVSTAVSKYEKFKEWYDEFLIKNPRGYGMLIKADQNWYNKCLENHKVINEIIDGKSVVIQHKFANLQLPANTDRAERSIQGILNYIPNYLGKYGYEKKVLYFPVLPDGMKTGKHIIGYINRFDKTQYIFSDEKKKEIEKYISILGEEWAKTRKDECEVTSILSTNPKAFISIGHYGPDSKSCLKNGGCNEKHKYVMATDLGNSFVLIVRTSSKTGKIELNSKNNYARMWGFYQKDTGTVNFCNFYSNDQLTLASIFDIAKAHAVNLLQIDEENLGFAENILKSVPNDVNIYHNHDKRGNWTFYNKLVMDKPKEIRIK
jgi:hypothetical protein